MNKRLLLQQCTNQVSRPLAVTEARAGGLTLTSGHQSFHRLWILKQLFFSPLCAAATWEHSASSACSFHDDEMSSTCCASYIITDKWAGFGALHCIRLRSPCWSWLLISGQRRSWTVDHEPRTICAVRKSIAIQKSGDVTKPTSWSIFIWHRICVSEESEGLRQ